MRKIKLDIDDLAVESFSTGDSEGVGTVRGHDTLVNDGDSYGCNTEFTCSCNTDCWGTNCGPGTVAPGNTCWNGCGSWPTRRCDSLHQCMNSAIEGSPDYTSCETCGASCTC